MTTGAAPIVLLHGVGLDRTMWAPVVALLEAAGRRTIALDLPGHGERPPLRAPQTLETLADDVRERLPEGPVHLVGFSLGALIAQHIARFTPERLVSLTAVSSVCDRTPAEREAVESRLATATSDFSASASASIERWFPEGSRVASQTIAATRDTLLGNDVESFVHAYTVFARGDQQIAPELPAIRVPALAITGELDPGSTPDMTARLARAIPNCASQIVTGARHMLPVEAPHEFAQRLLAFIIPLEGSRP